MNLLLTGGTGTFGTACAAHILARGLAEKVVVLSRGEHRQAAMAEQFGHDPRLRFLVGDVRDYNRLADALYRIDTVLHAAALKRIADTDPTELMQTNWEGTRNVVRAAVSRGIGRVMVLSSDKAVGSVTSYGTSKAAAEHYSVYANTFGHPRTRISVVRYGNVLGSQGSVVHLWRRQRAAGVPLTVTDSGCTRFLLTVDQAVRFTLRAVEQMRGGEIFVPRLPGCTVLDLAAAVAGDGSPVTLIGLRAGEKRHELLISEDEAERAVDVGDGGYVITPAYRTWPWTAPAGTPLPAGQRIASDTARRLDRTELRTLVASVPEES